MLSTLRMPCRKAPSFAHEFERDRPQAHGVRRRLEGPAASGSPAEPLEHIESDTGDQGWCDAPSAHRIVSSETPTAQTIIGDHGGRDRNVRDLHRRRNHPFPVLILVLLPKRPACILPGPARRDRAERSLRDPPERTPQRKSRPEPRGSHIEVGARSVERMASGLCVITVTPLAATGAPRPQWVPFGVRMRSPPALAASPRCTPLPRSREGTQRFSRLAALQGRPRRFSAILQPEAKSITAMTSVDRPTRDLCLQALLEHSVDNIYFKDLESRFVLVSRSMARWCGRDSPEELIGRTDADVFASPHADEALADEQRLIRRECDVIRKEERETWPDGRETWVSTVKRALLTPDGRVIGTFGISRDITAQRRAQAEMQATAQRYAELIAIVNRSPAVVFEWGPGDDWPVLNVSDNVRRFGLEPADLLAGRPPYASLIHPEDIARVREELATAVRSGADTYELEYRFVPAAGQVYYVEERGLIRRDESGRLVGYQGIVIDVTRRHEAERELERYRAHLEDMVAERTRDLEFANGRLREENARRRASEAALSESEQRYKRLLESVTDYVYTVELRNGQPVATHHGPGCEAVTGYTPEEYAADRYLWIEMVPPEDRDLVRRQSAQVLATGSAEPIEHRLRRKDGSIRWVRSHVAARRDADGRLIGYDGMVKDVTESREAREAQLKAELEAMQARQREALERADRLSSLGVLAAGLAHEISNPLQGMLSHLDAVRHALPADFPRAKNLEMIERGIETIASLVRELLCLGGPSEASNESCVLGDAIAFVRDLLAHQFQRRGIALQVDARELHVRLAMPGRELIQILLNLLMNARDAMPDGGSVTIAAETHEGRVALRISDTGIGIPDELLPRIFTPFFTTKGGKGTGLGLTVAESLVRQRHGHIEVRSRVGEGTTFILELPLAADKADRP